jgi:hypothetical protein
MTAAHTEPDARIPVTCCDCTRPFLALGAWQVRCRPCYAQFKGKTAQPAPLVDTAALESEIAELREQLQAAKADATRWRRLALSKSAPSPPIPQEQWRRLTQLAHPDKHSGSIASNEATQWLLENRP